LFWLQPSSLSSTPPSLTVPQICSFQLFGTENGHARIVSGVQRLPIGTPVMVEVIFEIK
jgi:hypothetical protein